MRKTAIHRGGGSLRAPLCTSRRGFRATGGKPRSNARREEIETPARSDLVRALTGRWKEGGQGRGRTADLPLFRTTLRHRPWKSFYLHNARKYSAIDVR